MYYQDTFFLHLQVTLLQAFRWILKKSFQKVKTLSFLIGANFEIDSAYNNLFLKSFICT